MNVDMITKRQLFMKTLLALLAFVLLSAFVVTPKKTTRPDPRLYEVLTKSEIDKLLDKNPFVIQYYNYFLDHSYKILEQPEGQKNLSLPTVRIKDINNFNILAVKREQNLQRLWNSPTYYLIEGTTKVLVFIPDREFTKKLNEHIEAEERRVR
jgi:hypothetical protein